MWKNVWRNFGLWASQLFGKAKPAENQQAPAPSSTQPLPSKSSKLVGEVSDEMNAISKFGKHASPWAVGMHSVSVPRTPVKDSLYH